MRVLLTGGGTGGHVYPALAVAEALRRDPEAAQRLELLYMGSRDGMEVGIVGKAGLPFRGISAGALRGRSPSRLLAGLGRTVVGTAQAWRDLGEYPADAVLATGGYVCVPVVLAAWLRRVPTLLYLPDVEPGLAVRALARLAARVAVTSAESKRFLPPRKVVETGYPVRPELWSVDRSQARRRLGVPADATVLLVFGGSRGARALNEAVAAALPRLLELAHVVHVCGGEDEARARARLDELHPPLVERYRLHAYLHTEEMAAALTSADLAVSRAGASVLGEYPAVGLPSVLVPYPFAGAHQRLNAELLAREGASVLLENSDVQAGSLLPTLEALLGDRERLRRMSAAARRLARPRAAEAIAQELRGLVIGRGTRQ